MAGKSLNALFGRVLLPLLLAAALVPRPVRTPFVNDPISEKVSESAAVDTEDGKERLNKTSEGNTSHDHAERIESITTEEVTNEFIVRFNEYRFAGEHKRALEQELGTNGWQWIQRNNPASFLPTDFGLLEIEIGYIDSICQQLKDLNFIKDISPQMRFTRAPLAEKQNASDMDMDTHQLHVTQAPVQGDSDNVWKPRGRPLTWMSIEEDDEFNWKLLIGNTSFANKRRLLLQRSQITSMFGAEKLWAKGFSGAKVKMAVFDTGVRADHPHFRNIKERTNWTNEDTLNDNLGHGTFVAGVISSQDPQCLGFAPDAEIYAFRVFTDAQVSYTSWFLDAFNYAIAKKINILNLSIGGPDYLDRPFVEKVWEMTANNIIMISAIGNDGPLYGTLNNPADQNDVIGVGGIDYNNHIASFSSRGMSTWELPHGYGRMKPDIVAYGREVIGSKINSGCKSLSGTSVASPVVAGAVCLLASTVPEEIRWNVLNPASMKQALMEGAIKLDGPNMYEQGAGRLNLLNSFEILANYIPRASIMPEVLDLTNCPYAWPFCRQPLYADAMPTMFNATILNGMGVVGYIQSGPFWIGHGQESRLLDIRFTYPDVIWPWTGYLGLYMQIKPEGRYFLGTIQGNVTFTVISPPPKGETKWRSCQCTLPIKVAVIPTPARGKRILWDQFHSIRYPPGYIPRDSLDVRNDILDWHGDHLHTNFHGLFDMLSDAGYYLETLGSPLTCFDAKQYGTLLMVDLEDEFYREEIDKLKIDVEIEGLGLIVFADWYNVETMVKMKFFDDNTRSWWTPATGGSNIPALNDLLAPFGIAFGDTILNGAYSIGGERAHYASGTDIRKFPMGGYLHRFLFHDNSGSNVLLSTSRSSVRSQVESPILGVVKADKGRIAAYGDSNCLDSSHMITNCYWLLRKLLDYTSYDIHDPVIFSQNNLLLSPFGEPETSLPTRRSDLNFSTYSLVLTNKLQCGNDSPFYFHESGNQLHDSLPQRQPRGTGNSSSSFMNETTQMESTITLEEDGGTKYVRPEVLLVNNSISGEASKETGNREKDIDKGRSFHRFDGRFVELGLPFVWSNKNELDWTVLALVHWLIPLICVTGFILILNLWRARQKRRRRTRKGPTRLLLF